MANPFEKFKNPQNPFAKFAQTAAPQSTREQTMAVMKERAAADPGREARTAEMDRQAETAMRDPGMLKSALIGANQGVTFGFGDEIGAGIAALSPNVTYDNALKANRSLMDDARFARPATTGAAEIGGALAMPLGALKSTGKLGLDMLRGAGMGGGMAGLYGFGAGEGGFENRAENAVKSGAIGAIGGGVVAPALSGIAAKIFEGVKRPGAIRTAARNAPTTEELRRMGTQAYDAVDNAGVRIDQGAFGSAVQGITDGMRRSGLDEGGMLPLTPKAARVTQVMEDAATAPAPNGIPFSEIDVLRRKAGVAASDMTNSTDSALGTQAISGLDDFINNLTPAQTVSGNAAELPQMINTARDIWGKMKRSQIIDDAIENSQNYLGGGASGIRNQFARILRSDKLSRGFSEIEKDLMRRTVNGSMPEKLLQLASGGMGQLATITGGAVSGGPVGALAGAGIAAGARRGAEALTARNAERVRSIIANGGLAQTPQLSDGTRRMIEALTRRAGAVGLQQ